jgi:hypothetical protein
VPADLDPLRLRIRQVLVEDWDPSNAQRFQAAHGEYDSYIDPLLDLIRTGGGGEQAVIEFLHAREQEIMCFPALGTQRLRRVAQRLIRAAASPVTTD